MEEEMDEKTNGQKDRTFFDSIYSEPTPYRAVETSYGTVKLWRDPVSNALALAVSPTSRRYPIWDGSRWVCWAAASADRAIKALLEIERGEVQVVWTDVRGYELRHAGPRRVH